MDLILWRHAEAQDPKEDAADPVAADLARPLTPKGERQAVRMAQWLNRRLPESTRVIASPARRTQQTADALQRTFQRCDALAPGATVEALLQAARWPDASAPVLIVGHQPTLGLTAARLLGGGELPWSMRKGAVWWLRRRVRDGDARVLLLAVQSPDCL